MCCWLAVTAQPIAAGGHHCKQRECQEQGLNRDKRKNLGRGTSEKQWGEKRGRTRASSKRGNGSKNSGPPNQTNNSIQEVQTTNYKSKLGGKKARQQEGPSKALSTLAQVGGSHRRVGGAWVGGWVKSQITS